VKRGRQYPADFCRAAWPGFLAGLNRPTHVDVENPPSRAADWACGQSNAARREDFGRYSRASLRTGLLGGTAAGRKHHAMTNDAAVRKVVWRKPGELSPAR
jgi:hypothetical protein